jgi:hypothetical protein
VISGWLLVGLTSDQETALIAGAAVLLGALMGGLVPALTTAHFEKRRDKADARQARRLVAEELRTHVRQLDQMLRDDGYRASMAANLLPDTHWVENRPTLARHLPDPVWDLLSVYMDATPVYRQALMETPPGDPFPPEQLLGFPDTRALVARIYTDLTGCLVED